MSDTPRTDKERDSDNGDSSLAYDYAEKLERELAAVTKDRDELINKHESLVSLLSETPCPVDVFTWLDSCGIIKQMGLK